MQTMPDKLIAAPRLCDRLDIKPRTLSVAEGRAHGLPPTRPVSRAPVLQGGGGRSLDGGTGRFRREGNKGGLMAMLKRKVARCDAAQQASKDVSSGGDDSFGYSAKPRPRQAFREARS